MNKKLCEAAYEMVNDMRDANAINVITLREYESLFQSARELNRLKINRIRTYEKLRRSNFR